MCSGIERQKSLPASIASYPHVIISSPATLVMLPRSPVRGLWEATMSDLPQPLLAHLQREARGERREARGERREARDARDWARASREETEKQIAASPQQLGESRTILQYVKKLEYGI
jgi:hypothetical protein